MHQKVLNSLGGPWACKTLSCPVATDACHVNIESTGQHAAVELLAARAARGRRDIHSAESDGRVKT